MNQIGKYSVIGQLGRGGMGVVYRGRDPVIQRDVAIKLIRKADLAPEEAGPILARFKREAQAAGNLHHPNIVAIYEYGEDEELAYIAMECVMGKSLRDHLLAGFRPEFREFPEVIDQLLEGLDYSHSRGVVHRDLKPANLLISESGVVKISDFGIARLETSHLTMVGEVMGTPFYMSPEQFLGETADERSDIYSAAVIVYEALAGRRPFSGGGAAIMKQVLEDSPQPPSSFEARINAQLDEVILRALSKSRSDRPRSAREFSDELHQAFEMGLGAPPEKRERPKRSQRSRRSDRPQRSGRAIPDDGLEGSAQAERSERTPPLTPPTLTPPPTSTRPPTSTLPQPRLVGNAAVLRRALGGTGPQQGSPGRRPWDLNQTAGGGLTIEGTSTNAGSGGKWARAARAASGSEDWTIQDVTTPPAGNTGAGAIGTVGPGDAPTTPPGGGSPPDVLSATGGPVARAAARLAGGSAENVAPAFPTTNPPGSRRPCVLFVDDEERVLNALRTVFRSTYEVEVACDGEHALEIVRNRPVSLVVSDQRMPGMTGVDLLRGVKEISPGTVRILLTGYSDLAAIVGSINDGEVFRFINKPWNQQELMTTVAEAVTIAVALQASPPRASESRSDPSTVLVLDDEATYRAVRELMNGNCTVSHAKTLDEAFGILAHGDVAALIADLESRLVELAVLFRALKEEYPETLVIVTTGASDSEQIITLINEARIFRFVNKPVNLALMQQHVNAALDRFEQFKKSPQFARTQSPSRPAGFRDSALVHSLLARLRSVRALLGAGLRA